MPNDPKLLQKAGQRIAANVTRLLGEQNMSQAELGRRANLGKLAVHRLVNCTYAVPDLGTLLAVAGALGVTVDALLAVPACPKKSCALA